MFKSQGASRAELAYIIRAAKQSGNGRQPKRMERPAYGLNADGVVKLCKRDGIADIQAKDDMERGGSISDFAVRSCV